ncbi:MAG: Rieske 2Fe-2S domain-containing protein [Candidatus Kapabacteria bacterium]|nr:Rieske 2Fe-2S domain-containing protein [Candidatus Kapabacteria bacterium]
MENSNKTNNRRNFIKTVSSALGVGLVFIPLSQFLSSCEHQEPTGVKSKELIINLNQYPSLNEVGKFQKITENNLPIVIIRKSQTEFLVLSLICTHQGCEVDVPDSNNVLNCYCHNSKFSANDGSVMKGPDDGSNIASLKKFQNTFDSNTNQLKIIF